MLRQQVSPRVRQARASYRALPQRLVPVVYAAVVAGALGGAAFASQALVLPRPSSAQLLAVQADRWLVRHRVIRSVQHVGGHPRVRATCVQTWLGPAAAIPVRDPGAIVVTSQGSRLIDVRKEVFRFGRGLTDAESPSALATFELAGCPWLLGSRLSAALELHQPIGFSRTRVGARAALEFRLRHGRRRIEIFVDARTFRPLAVAVSAPHVRGWSMLERGSFGLAERLVRQFRLLLNPPARKHA